LVSKNQTPPVSSKDHAPIGCESPTSGFTAQRLVPRLISFEGSYWPKGALTLILAPTGTGKTLAAFLSCLDRLMFAEEPSRDARCRVLYLSPLKALAVDVERNLRAPLAGITRVATAQGLPFHAPT